MYLILHKYVQDLGKAMLKFLNPASHCELIGHHTHRNAICYYLPKMHALSVMPANEIMCMQMMWMKLTAPHKEEQLTVTDFSEWHHLPLCHWGMMLDGYQYIYLNSDWEENLKLLFL